MILKSLPAVAIVIGLSFSKVIAQQIPGGGLLTSVSAEKAIFRVGDPILVSVAVTNQTSGSLESNTGATAFDTFEVLDPDGKRLRYVGFDGQMGGQPIQVRPFATAVIEGKLDLTEKYLFQKAGRYSIRFTEERWTGLSASSLITIDVTPGKLSGRDEMAATLLPVCPDGWHMDKGLPGEAYPRGRAHTAGFMLHLCHNHMADEQVDLWFTKTEAKAGSPPVAGAMSEYLGQTQGLFVYISVGKGAPALWPDPTGELSRTLHLGAQ